MKTDNPIMTYMIKDPCFIHKLYAADDNITHCLRVINFLRKVKLNVV